MEREDNGEARFIFKRHKDQATQLKWLSVVYPSPDFDSFFIIMLLYPYHWGWPLQPLFFLTFSLPGQSSISPVCDKQNFTCIFSEDTFSDSPALQLTYSVFQSLCQNNPLLIKLMKSLATGSDSFTMEQGFKVRFNAQNPNHRKLQGFFSSLGSFDIFINRWSFTECERHSNTTKNINATDAEP